VDSKYLKTLKGLLELEAAMPEELTRPRIVQPPLCKPAFGSTQRKAYRLQDKLAALGQIDPVKAAEQTKLSQPPRLLERIEPPRVRPPTPGVEEDSDEADAQRESELGVVTLQKLLRGRAEQNLMFEGRQRRQELINELRTTHALRDTERTSLKKNVAAAQQRMSQVNADKIASEVVDSAVSEMTGQQIGSMVDYLSKELVRLQEERRIQAMVMLAERQRRMREAEESGLRQAEELKRQQQDLIFKHTVNVHQATVDTYLEDIILSAQSATADEQGNQFPVCTQMSVSELPFSIRCFVGDRMHNMPCCHHALYLIL
jgi:hypothetical protein